MSHPVLGCTRSAAPDKKKRNFFQIRTSQLVSSAHEVELILLGVGGVGGSHFLERKKGLTCPNAPAAILSSNERNHSTVSLTIPLGD